MKNTMKKLMAMSMLLVSLVANAENENPKPVMEVTSVNTERFVVFVEELKGTMFIQIKDDMGVSMYREKVKSGTTYKKMYDLSTIPNGTYYLKIVDDSNNRIYSILKKSNRLVVKVDFDAPKIDKKVLAILMD
jgi:hypothetical protein